MTDATDVLCPRCSSSPSHPCVTPKGRTRTSHHDRWVALASAATLLASTSGARHADAVVQYVRLAFRNLFPQAGRISVDVADSGEVITVVMDDAVFVSAIGTDDADDDYHFRCRLGREPDVSFPGLP